MEFAVRYVSGANVAEVGSRERRLLATLLIVIYIVYAALGRDVFFNTLFLHMTPGATANGFEGDPIGYFLPQARVLICALVAFVVAANAGLTWAASKIPVMFAPFCLYALASSRWAADSHDVIRDSIVLLCLWVSLPMLIHRIGAVEMVRASLRLVAGVAILSFLVAILFPEIGRHGAGEAFQSAHAGRWRGIFGHKNGLAPWAAYGSVFLFTHGWLCGGPRLFWWATGCLAMICLVMCGSATGLVMTLALWYAWAMFMMLRRFPLPAVAAVAIGTVLVAGCCVYFAADTFFELLGRDSSLTGRTAIWALASDYFWDKPWFGNGYQQLGGPQFLDEIYMGVGQAIPGPESAYLEMLLDVGVIGALLFAAPMVVCVRNGFEWMKHVRLEDRASIEFMLMTLFAVLVGGYAESGIMISTGFDGVLSFGSFFALLTTPKSPEGVLRGEFRLAKYRFADAARSSK